MPSIEPLSTRYFIGIDDTDNRESRGTGYRARTLGAQLEEKGLAILEGVTRHQLLVSPAIPYTSHNSAACLSVLGKAKTCQELAEFCRHFLLTSSAPGADAGLCITAADQVSPALYSYGRRAKQKILNPIEAWSLAHQEKIYLEGLTGNRGGIIGALAAVGLRAEGEDGRFIGLRGIREQANRRYSWAELQKITAIDQVQCLDGTPVINLEDIIDLGPWARPILREGKAVLLVEKSDGHQNSHWRVIPREVIKQF